ncbi:hypothetical protein U9M48_041192 [Paspalum notatum var. saurae]|uniref:Uncharacterized protein n=1 Tax=Paspalum notatum var. saurae TaxID=547442 RepID=A0AAQ3UTY6_PASNO
MRHLAVRKEEEAHDGFLGAYDSVRNIMTLIKNAAGYHDMAQAVRVEKWKTINDMAQAVHVEKWKTFQFCNFVRSHNLVFYLREVIFSVDTFIVEANNLEGNAYMSVIWYVESCQLQVVFSIEVIKKKIAKLDK